MQEVDVIVLGAGISGAVASALLSRKGYRVVLISKDAGTSHHLPESWIYRSSPLFSHLDIEEKLKTALKKQSRCFFSSADGRYSLELSLKDAQETIENGDLVSVNRNQFDRVLLEGALKAGVEMISRSRIVDCQISSPKAIVSCENEERSFDFTAPLLIDATGKTAFLSTHLDLPIEEVKLDSRICCFTHFEGFSEQIDQMEIVAIKGGYLFCIPIGSQRISLGCVRSEEWMDSNGSLEDFFISSISLSPRMSKLVAGAKKMLPTILAKNHQKICLEPANSNYRLVGDAAAFVDPFFAPGIDFAFFSAEQAVLSIEYSSALNYKEALMNWLKGARGCVYDQIEQMEWNGIMRLFADPHLPFLVPLLLTQAFGQTNASRPSLKEGIQTARDAYAMAIS